jgi:hypothetical protein
MWKMFRILVGVMKRYIQIYKYILKSLEKSCVCGNLFVY